MRRPIAVVDVETTGLHPFRWNNYVVEVGIVVVSPALEKVWRGDWDVRVPNPFVVLTREFWSAKRVHKKTLREMFGRDNLPVERVVEDLDWLHGAFPDAIVGGQNAGFDHSFLKSMYEFSGRRSPWDYHLLDLTALAIVHLGTSSLSDTMVALGIDPKKYTKHSAIGDAEATADALIALLKRVEKDGFDAAMRNL